jgi:MYXO-CTERM domain-containing protein
MRRRFPRLSRTLALCAAAAAAGCAPSAGDPTPRQLPPAEPAANPPDGALGAAQGREADWYLVLEGPPAAALLEGEDPAAAKVAARTSARLEAITRQQDELVDQLRARGIPVQARLARLANVVQVLAAPEALPELRELPGVRRIERVPILRPLLQSAVPVTGAPEAWSSPAGLHGEGVTLGVIDSGIDYHHGDLGGSGDPMDFNGDDPTLIEPGSFPTARVVGGTDFVGNDYDAGSPANAMASPDPDPLDCVRQQSFFVSGGHGSHVAGIAAGNGVLLDGTPFTGPYDQSLDPSLFRVAPGVAPAASLVALKIFGCSGSTAFLASALEYAADPDGDGNFSDRLDVVNASLGSSYGLQSKVNAELVRNLTAAGTLLVVAAGNEGDNFFVAGSPGNYPQTLSVAASSDNPLITLEVTAPAAAAAELPALEGSFTAPLAQNLPLEGELVLTQPDTGCDTLSNSDALAGNIAVVWRGSCSFVSKLARIEGAGAKAAVVIDDEYSDVPFSMGGGDPGEIGIVGAMVRRLDGEAMLAALPGVQLRFRSDRFDGLGSELFTGFSSRGPSSVDTLLKPEISAPGFAIDSAQVGSGSESRQSQGTSMACPVVAGAAALVRQADPAIGPLEAKARLVNSAADLRTIDGLLLPVSRAGGGRVDVAEAVARTTSVASAALDGRGAVSFGAVIAAEPVSLERSVRLENRGAAAVEYTASATQHHPLPGVTVSVEPATITVPAGFSAEARVILSLDPHALGVPSIDPVTPEQQFDLPRHYLNEAAGALRFEAGDGHVLRLPFYASVRAASTRAAAAVSSCGSDTSQRLRVALDDSGAHPQAVTTAFELGKLDDAEDDSPRDPSVARRDVRAVGAASNSAAAAGLDDTTLYFGVVLEGEWTSPALGPQSPVTVLLDVNGDTATDFFIRAEPLNAEEPFADVLAATTYDADSGEPVGTKRFLNMVPAGEYDTAPFHNNVLVMSVFASDVGLSEDNPEFSYGALASSADPMEGSDLVVWAPFDVTRPTLDTARHAPDPGVPLYPAGAPVVAELDGAAAAEAANPPSLLLLHHTNGRGQRWEVVSSADATALSVAVSHQLPVAVDGAAAAGAVASGAVTIRNDSSDTLHELTLSGSVDGGVLELAAPTRGTCEDGPAIACTIDALAPGESVDVMLRLQLRSDAESANVALEVLSAEGCAASLSHDIALTSGAVPAGDLRAAGGCECTLVASRPVDSPWRMPAIGLLALALWRRRRQRVAAR